MSELSWGLLIAAYLFVGGMAGGAYVVGALADIFGRGRLKSLSESGAYVSAAGILAGLVLLVLDLGRFDVDPLSPLNAYINLPASIMTVGTWIITAFTAVSLGTAALWLLRGNELVRRLCEVAGFLLGASTAAYTGILLSFSRGRPLWGSPYLPWLFVISGLLTGLAMAQLLIPLLAVLAPRPFREFRELANSRGEFSGVLGEMEGYHTVLEVVELGLLALFVATTPGGGLLLTATGVSQLFLAYLASCLLIPLGVGYYAGRLRRAGREGAAIPYSMFGLASILVGGFLLRYVVIIAGQLFI